MLAVEQQANGYCFETCGSWPDEPSSCAEFDDRLSRFGLFYVYSEVEGYYLQPRLGSDEQQPRIDRLLVPKPSFIDKGWKYGAIGVECKASKKKLGHIVSQCLDYSRAAFKIPERHISVLCSWVFIWPLEMPLGDISSVMCQNTIGAVHGWRAPELSFKCGGTNMLTLRPGEEPKIGKVLSGRKVGSR